MRREFKKSQEVRLWDVFFIGPFLLYLAWKGKLSDLDKMILTVLGGLTILYNWMNYQRTQAQ